MDDKGKNQTEHNSSSAAVVGTEVKGSMNLEKMGEVSLLIAVGRSSDKALAEIYRRHGGSVYSLAARVLNSHARAEEVTQDVFVGLWQHPERFNPEKGTLRTLLLTIAHRRAVDLVRSDRARTDREDRSARQTATAGYDLESHAWDLAVAGRVKEALLSLPEGERRAIELAYFEGCTYREVASLLDTPEGTVKSRIRSGLKRLRSVLGPKDLTAWIES